MISSKVNFQTTTTAVLKDFNQSFTVMVTKLLEEHNAEDITEDGEKQGFFTDVHAGNGLLIMADSTNNEDAFTITTEFLVPSNDLAASFMVMWRRWCDKRNISSQNGLTSLMNKVAIKMNENINQDNQYLNSNLAIGLMGAVLDNYPEIVDSMRWSVNCGFSPCLVIANDSEQVKCGVCYGGKYKPA